jgi:cobalt-zinc-cadmium efflux system outer membrane protein
VAGALAGLSRTQWTILQSELQTVAQTERLFFNAIYCRALRDLARAIAETNERLLGVMQRRYEAGQANTADVATVKWDARSSRQEADLAEANYATARFALYRQLDLSPDVALELVGDLARCRWLPIREGSPGTGSGAADPDDPATRLTDADIERLVTARPDVLAACADLDAAAASLSLARAGRVPNLQLGPVYERDDAGTLFFGFKSQVDVPVVNTGKSLVQQRIAEYCQRRITAQQLEAKAAIEGKTAVRRYERAREAVGRAKRDFAETLPDELRQIENLFQAGQVDLPRVFAARSSVLQSRRAYLDLLNEAAQSAADVTATIGLPPDELVVMPAGDDDRAARHSGRQVDAM